MIEESDDQIMVNAPSYTLRAVDDYQPRVEWVPKEDFVYPDSTAVRNWRLEKTLREYLKSEGMSREQWVRMALTDVFAAPVPNGEGMMVPWMPGHRLDLRRRMAADMYGPCEGIRLMIITTAPEPQGYARRRHMWGGPCEFIDERLRAWRVPEESVYVTSVCRFGVPFGESKIKDIWCKAAYELVAAEAMMLQPDVILCMGAPAVKALWGAGAKLTAWRGTPQEWEHFNNTPTVVTTNPVQFMLGYAGKKEWEDDVDMAILLAFGDRGTVQVESPNDEDKLYELASTADEFELYTDLILEQNPKLLVFDCEWGNDYGCQQYGYTISCQVSWGPKAAVFFKLRQPGTGAVIHSEEDYQRCISALRRLLADNDIQIGGHNLRVDVKELFKHGIDLREKMRWGLDSMLIHHLLHQDDDQGLDVLVRKYCPTLGAYWADLEAFLDYRESSKDPGRSSKLRHGYRDIPEHILVPYGQIDADATYRCILALQKEWAGEEYKRIRALYHNIVMPSNEAILEIEHNGIRLDMDRMKELHDQFHTRYNKIRDKLAEKINWGTKFNPASVDNICTLLFNDTPFKGSDKKRRKVPPGGRTFNLEPICNTDKYPKDWALLKDRGLERFHRPSTKAEALKILVTQLKNRRTGWKRSLAEYEGLLQTGEGDEDRVEPVRARIRQLDDEIEVVQHIHDLKILAQFLNNFLKRPNPSKEQSERICELFGDRPAEKLTDEEVAAASLVPGVRDIITGKHVLVYEDGKSFLECTDRRTQRASGTILQTTDTGRGRMFAANLMVFPKKQEKEIERIFEDESVDKIKSCVIPREPGDDGEEWVITEADFKQAENWIMAIAGQDEAMLKILLGGRDLHSENCYNAFKVDMPVYWGWNGDDPENGEACEEGADFEHVRRVLPLNECVDPVTGDKLPHVNGLPAEGVCDYDVWAGAIKGLYPDKRTAAKTISFGVPYGRKAAALAREIRKAGIDITDEAAEELVAAFYRDYPGVAKLLQTAREMAVHPDYEYVETLFGRRRYFTGASQLDNVKQSSAQREAGNFPIQGCVADLLYKALNNFMAVKKSDAFPGLEFNLLLTVHDAVIIEHKKKDTELMYQIIKFCMADENPIPGTGDMKLGVDLESFTRWGDGKTMTARDSYQPELTLAA